MQETLPDEILAKMHAAPKPDVPIMDPHDLPNADGLMFGFPTRYATQSKLLNMTWAHLLGTLSFASLSCMHLPVAA